MTFLGTSLFFSKPGWVPSGVNAAPSIPDAVLNFDYAVNTAPTGTNHMLAFVVEAYNAAPTISTSTLNFDLVVNAAPSGSNQALVFGVEARNAAPTISTATLNFDFALNAAPTGDDQMLAFRVLPSGSSNSPPINGDVSMTFEVLAA